jgi:hypothetical protein
MQIPEFFRYSNLVSVPLFSVIAFTLARQAQGMSLRSHTVSETILFLTKPSNHLLFRFNFIIKSLLDVSFVLYYLNRLNVPNASATGVISIVATLLFGLLALVLEGKHSFAHKCLAYAHVITWSIGQLLLFAYIPNASYQIFTSIILILFNALVFYPTASPI